MEVEITQQMAGRSLADMSRDDIQVLMDETKEQAIEDIKKQDSTLTLGSIGSAYMVGPIDCTVAIGNFVLLHEIDSPFVNGTLPEEGEEIDGAELIKSLYVLALGKEAIKPVMAIKQRIQSLMHLKPMVEKNPGMFEQLLDRAERISEAHADFELTAMDWYNDNFAGCDFQEVVNDTFATLVDVMKAAGDLPSGDDSKKK